MSIYIFLNASIYFFAYLRKVYLCFFTCNMTFLLHFYIISHFILETYYFRKDCLFLLFFITSIFKIALTFLLYYKIGYFSTFQGKIYEYSVIWSPFCNFFILFGLVVYNLLMLKPNYLILFDYFYTSNFFCLFFFLLSYILRIFAFHFSLRI